MPKYSCGCRFTIFMADEDRGVWDMCPLHAAAEEMKEELLHLEDLVVRLHHTSRSGYYRGLMLERLDSIKKIVAGINAPS